MMTFVFCFGGGLSLVLVALAIRLRTSLLRRALIACVIVTMIIGHRALELMRGGLAPWQLPGEYRLGLLVFWPSFMIALIALSVSDYRHRIRDARTASHALGTSATGPIHLNEVPFACRQNWPPGPDDV